MVDSRFSTYPGKFPCKQCEEEVKSLRLWIETGDATWMCSNKHLSRVQLIPKKKTKKDYEREEREQENRG
jgi:hypothetical protein